MTDGHPPAPPADTVGAFVGEPSTLALGAPDGPLAGRTLAVKDVIDVAGTVTGAGNPDFAAGRTPAPTSATAVDRLVAAGATVIGKTITDELAYSLSGTNVHHGTPTNPAAPGRVPGGSSAGSASAVAAGICDLALGTDTGGSIRVPASYCGLVGWRPTHGAVPTSGVVHLARTFDTVGLLARSIDLLATAAEALLPPSGPGEVQVSDAVRVIDLMAAVDGERRRSIEGATAFADDDVDLGIDLAEAADAFRVLQGAEAWAEHGAWVTTTQPVMGGGIAERFAAASRVTVDEVAAAQVVRDRVVRVVAQATTGGRVIVGPAAACAAPRPDDAGSVRARNLQLSCLAGLAGAPVVVLPRATDGGLPLGVACMAGSGTDRALLRWASSLPATAPPR